MSKSVDAQRAEEAAEAESYRLEKFLLELLATVRARRLGSTWVATAASVDRSESTIHRRRRTLEQVLDTMKRKGIRHTQ